MSCISKEVIIILFFFDLCVANRLLKALCLLHGGGQNGIQIFPGYSWARLQAFSQRKSRHMQNPEGGGGGVDYLKVAEQQLLNAKQWSLDYE